MSRIRKNWILVFMLVVAALSFAGVRKTSAAISVDEIYQGVMGNAIYECYSDAEMWSTVSGADYSTTNDNAETAFRNLVLKGGSKAFNIPTGVGAGNEIKPTTTGGTRINCSQLFLGGGGLTQGLFGLFGKQMPTPHSANIGEELKNLGYINETTDRDSTMCIEALYGFVGAGYSKDKSAGKVCWKDNEIPSGASWDDFVSAAKFTKNSDGVSVSGLIKSNTGVGASGQYVGIMYKDTSTNNLCQVTTTPASLTGRTWYDVINDLAGQSCTIINAGAENYEVETTAATETGGDSGEFKEYSWPSPQAAANKAKMYFTGSNIAQEFTVEDRYVLYKNYLDNIYGANYGNCKAKSELSSWKQTDATGATVYYVYSNGLYYNVGFPDASKTDLKVSAFGNSNTKMEGYWDLETLLGSMWNMNFPETATCTEDTPPGGGGSMSDPKITKPGSGKLAEGAGVDCNQFDNIGAMQWILCPVMNNEQYTASWIDNQTRDWLQVETKIYDNQSIKDVWGNIRNIANVIIMIILLVIIFSQVTGYGIDNYGIKRMLPKLIIMAILVNLSFIICQLLIDLSNIVGSGLMGMFTQVSGASSTSDTSFIGSMITGFFAAGATGGPAAVAAFSTVIGVASEAIVIALVVAAIVFLLVVIIAVVVLFLMLGAREVIIVLCIILSPLAFAAYILPNTQNLAKKWWELFKAAIVIFPICGAMAGISNMLRAMYNPGTKANEYTDGTELNTWGYAILLILPYLGYFLIPILLKNALSALGKVGGALTALGNTVKNGGKAVGSGAMKMGQNTNAFKDWQARQQEKNAQSIIDKVNKAKAAGKTPSKWAQKRAYDAQMQLNKMKQEQALVNQGAPVLDDEVAKYRAVSAKEAQGLKDYADQYAGLSRADMSAELNAAAKGYRDNRTDDNALRLQAAIIAAEQRGMYNEMLNGDLMALDLSGGDNGRGEGVGARDTKILARLAGSNNKVFSQYGKQMGKKSSIDNNVSQSMAQFVKGNGNSSVNMEQAFANQGSNVLNGMDDDTLEYISKNNHNAVSTQMLTNAAMNTTNEKELGQINSMLSQKATAGVADYEMKPAELAKLNSNTVEAMNPAVYSKAVADIKNDPNSAANQQILNSMDQGVRSKLGLDDDSLVQARNMQPGYANKTPDDVYGEAEAENARINAQRKAEADHVATQQAEVQQKVEQANAINRLADSMDRFVGGTGRGPVVGTGTGRGPAFGAKMGTGYMKGENEIWLPRDYGQNEQKPSQNTKDSNNDSGPDSKNSNL